MNPQAFQTLEFDKLRALVARNAQTELGRKRLEEIMPVDDFDGLQSDLVRLRETIELRNRGGRFSFGEVVDASDALSRLRIAGTALEPLAILDLARVIDRALEARAVIHEHREVC